MTAQIEYQTTGFTQVKRDLYENNHVERLNSLSSVLGGETNMSDYLVQGWYRAGIVGVCNANNEIAGMYVATISHPDFMPKFLPSHIRNGYISFMSFVVDDKVRGQGYGHGLMRNFFSAGISSLKEELKKVMEPASEKDGQLLQGIEHPLITLETANPVVQYLFHKEASDHGYVFESPLLDPLKQFRPIVIYMDKGESQGQLIAEYKSFESTPILGTQISVPSLRVERQEFVFPNERFPQVARGVSDFGRRMGVVYDHKAHEIVPGNSHQHEVRAHFDLLQTNPVIRRTPLTYRENPIEFRMSCVLPTTQQ